MKKRIAVAAVLLVALVAVAGPIKTWSAGEVIVASDLNANFQHIHNLMVGGHGARLVNSDVSASAGISHSKLATPALLPKAMGGVVTACTSGPCSWGFNSGHSNTFARASAGNYTMTLSSARANATYGIQVTCGGSASSGAVPCTCSIRNSTITTTTYQVDCSVVVTDGGVSQNADVAFTVAVFDDNN